MAGRRLQNYARRQGGYVKNHEPLPEARVIRIFPEKGSGFLATLDGREIYFHQPSLINQAFRRMTPGEKEPQASTVRMLGRGGIHLVETTAAASPD